MADKWKGGGVVPVSASSEREVFISMLDVGLNGRLWRAFTSRYGLISGRGSMGKFG